MAQLNIKLKERQKLLEEGDPLARLAQLHEIPLQSEIEILQVEKKIKRRVRTQMEKSQKEVYLNEQMQAIQKELGERDEFKTEVAEIEARIANKELSAEAKEKLDKEVRKLKLMSPMSAEAAVLRNYIDTVLSLPWYSYSSEMNDIAHALRVLDADHYGLKKVKERILEYIAVGSLVERMKDRFSAWWVLPGSVKPLWPAPLLVRPTANSSDCLWAVFATKPRSEAIVAPTLERFQASCS